jgi:hypothetical protein
MTVKGVDMDKATLLDRFFANRMLFEKTVSRVGETSMLEPIGPDQHTGKDIIAHLTAWEQLNGLLLDVPLLILYNGDG